MSHAPLNRAKNSDARRISEQNHTVYDYIKHENDDSSQKTGNERVKINAMHAPASTSFSIDHRTLWLHQQCRVA